MCTCWLIVKDSEQDHSMGSPMNVTAPRSEDLIEIVMSKTICAVTVWRPLKQLWSCSLSFTISKCTQQSNTHFISNQQEQSNKKGKERWLSVDVMAHWQSAGSLSQRPWVWLPAAPPFFLSPYCFKGLQTVTAQIVFELTFSIRSLDHGGVPCIGLPMLSSRSPSFTINL